MNNITILLIILAIVAVFFIGICIVVPLLVKKGINLSGIISGASTALDTAGVLVDGIQQFAPESAGLAIVEKIINYAKEAAKAAEQMYIASGMGTDERKITAYEQVATVLGYAGIEITPEIENIINTSIEAAVFALPKTHVAE